MHNLLTLVQVVRILTIVIYRVNFAEKICVAVQSKRDKQEDTLRSRRWECALITNNTKTFYNTALLNYVLRISPEE